MYRSIDYLKVSGATAMIDENTQRLREGALASYRVRERMAVDKE